MRKVKKLLRLSVYILSALLICGKKTEAADESSLTVQMSNDSGIYSEAFTLSLSCDDASKIYYTLDGSNPTVSDSRVEYTAGINISDRSGDENVLSAVSPRIFSDGRSGTYIPSSDEVDKGTVVRAVAVGADGIYGSVITNTYFIGTVAEHIEGAKESAEAAGIPLSVMSISMDYDDLFDEDKGIYMNYSEKGRDWERAAHVDYFETDGENLNCKLQQDCGIRIQGNYSRSDLMKGFRLYARSDYGKKSFKYPFFEDAKDSEGETITKYKKIVLRNGGNYAFYGTKYNDAYWQSMLAGLNCETQSSRACVVYIDGEYWGLYVLQQDYDDNYFEVTHGVNADSVVIYKASDAEEDKEYGYKLDEGTLPEGENAESYYFNELLAFFQEHPDLKKTEDYNAFAELVDVQSVMDYFAVNVWINNKWDWPGKNWSMWRSITKDENNSYSDNKWRFCFYDLDFGGCGGKGDVNANTIKEDNYNTSIDSNGKYTNTEGLLGQNLKEAINPALQCFILCMSNDSFRQAYEAKLSALGETAFASDTAVAKLDWFRATYEPLFKQFYTRYYGIKQANDKVKDTVSGYAGYNNLKEFVTGRSKTIATINDYIEKKYVSNSTDTSDGSDTTDEGNANGDPDNTPTGDGADNGSANGNPDNTPTGDGSDNGSANGNPDNTPTGDATNNGSANGNQDNTPTGDATNNGSANGNQDNTPTGDGSDNGSANGNPDNTPTGDATDKDNVAAGTSSSKKSTIKIIAKKGQKKIAIKTVKKGKVTITLSKKILLKGKKRKKTIVLTPSENATGTVNIMLSSKLSKGVKIKVTVEKSGYKTTTKSKIV